MTYGPNWPPPLKTEPAPAVRPRRRFTLWQKCAAIVAGYAVVAVLGLLAIHLFVPPFDPAGSPTPLPHPAKIHGHR
jgi:hypothetical protein